MGVLVHGNSAVCHRPIINIRARKIIGGIILVVGVAASVQMRILFLNHGGARRGTHVIELKDNQLVLQFLIFDP